MEEGWHDNIMVCVFKIGVYIVARRRSIQLNWNWQPNLPNLNFCFCLMLMWQRCQLCSRWRCTVAKQRYPHIGIVYKSQKIDLKFNFARLLCHYFSTQPLMRHWFDIDGIEFRHSHSIAIDTVKPLIALNRRLRYVPLAGSLSISVSWLSKV